MKVPGIGTVERVRVLPVTTTHRPPPTTTRESVPGCPPLLHDAPLVCSMASATAVHATPKPVKPAADADKPLTPSKVYKQACKGLTSLLEMKAGAAREHNAAAEIRIKEEAAAAETKIKEDYAAAAARLKEQRDTRLAAPKEQREARLAAQAASHETLMKSLRDECNAGKEAALKAKATAMVAAAAAAEKAKLSKKRALEAEESVESTETAETGAGGGGEEEDDDDDGSGSDEPDMKVVKFRRVPLARTGLFVLHVDGEQPEKPCHAERKGDLVVEATGALQMMRRQKTPACKACGANDMLAEYAKQARAARKAAAASKKAAAPTGAAKKRRPEGSMFPDDDDDEDDGDDVTTPTTTTTKPKKKPSLLVDSSDDEK